VSLTTHLPDDIAVPGGPPPESPASALGRRARSGVGFVLRDRPLAIAGAVLALLILVALLVPLIRHDDPLEVDLLQALQKPSLSHPMGTDAVGRDVLARFLEGARISLLVGFLVILVGSIIGGLIGLLGGVMGGFTDGALMRIMDAILAFPPLILAMATTLGLGAGLTAAALGIMIASVPWYARVLRSEVLRVRSLPFVEAATALGAPRRQVVARHVVPHVIPTLMIQASAAFGYAILSLAALGFVGLGAQIPTPEWGAMITDGLQYTLTGQWWISVFPGLGVLIVVVAANVIADRARDILDPRGDYARV
jgi:peptide/nickel transport system permease protein